MNSLPTSTRSGTPLAVTPDKAKKMLRFATVDTIVGATVLACLLAAGEVAQPQNGVRAALDFTFRVVDGTQTEEVTCDFCGYDFRDGSGQIVTLSVSAARGYVDVFFLDLGAAGSSWGPLVHPQSPVGSSSDRFEVEYFQKARVREGQTLKLRGRSIEFTLIDAFGPGCPPGAVC